jgi:Fic family protein
VHRFDYSFLASEPLSAGIVNTAVAISELKARSIERARGHREIVARLESIARVQSVKGSNAIEGIVTTDKRIEAIVNENSAPLNHDEAEIAGYRDALALVHDNHEYLEVSEQSILHLHELMLAYTPQIGGSYKGEDNLIIQVDAAGRRSVRFEPVCANDTAEAMQQLILAYRDAHANYHINQVLLIPCVVLDFLCIHPFWDGNGRASRLLSILLLYKADLDVGRYISFEQQINTQKSAYYEALGESSKGWHENRADYRYFIQNFAMTLLACYKELDRRFVTVLTGKGAKSKRIEQAVLASVLPISKREIASLLPDVSVTTIEAVLGTLLKQGSITKLGAGPATKYRKAQR